MEDIEDAYTYYVLILGISEELFWNAERCELESIVANKTAYDEWLNYTKQKMTDEAKRK